MDAATLHRRADRAATAGPGELVLQTGRQAGARRPLATPATFLGRDTHCDIRLNVDGVDPLHCVVLCGPDGIELRDLNSVTGTFVNGERVAQVMLSDGDLLKIGPFQFKLEAAPGAAARAREESAASDELRDAWRIQTAAVAAQQIALDEEEARLCDRRHNLQQQEEQLAAHLAEKQRQIQLWADYTKAERESLRKQKVEHENHVARIEQELTQTRQDLHKDQKKIAEEKERIQKVYQRLRQRWQKQWGSERENLQAEAHRLTTQAEEIAEARREIEARALALHEEFARFNAERELSRRELDETRAALENAQQAWRQRRANERLAIKTKLRDIETGEMRLQEARHFLIRDTDSWRRQQRNLEDELLGLNRRILHQRARVQKHEEEVARLDQLMRERREQLAAPQNNEPAQPTEVSAAEAPATETPTDERLRGLERLSGDLADQRVQLIEQYQRLTQIHQLWHTQRDQATADLEALAQRLVDQEQALAERDQQAQAAADTLRERQEEIEVIRQEMQVWRAQLSARDKVSEDEHGQHLLALHAKEQLLQDQLNSIAQLRLRWKDRRQDEADRLQASRHMLEQQQKEAANLRAGLFAKMQELEEQKRIVAEKALALEQYRQETLGRTNDAVAERRVERLRRRWLTVNAALIRSARSEREAAGADLARIEAERAELAKQLEQLTKVEVALADRQNGLDQREADLKARLLRLNAHAAPTVAYPQPVAVEKAA